MGRGMVNNRARSWKGDALLSPLGRGSGGHPGPGQPCLLGPQGRLAGSSLSLSQWRNGSSCGFKHSQTLQLVPESVVPHSGVGV